MLKLSINWNDTALKFLKLWLIEGNGDDEKNAKPRTRRRRSWRMRVAYKIAEKEMEESECLVVYSHSLYVNESKMHLST